VASTEPHADSRITALPERVVIHVLKKQATRAGDPIQVLDPDGVRIDTGETLISDNGATISVGLRAGTRRSGTYIVSYKITSADTHIIHDRFMFSLTPMSNETVSAAAPNAAAPGNGAVRNDTPAPLAATNSRLRLVGPPGGSYLGVGLVVAALLALAVMLIRRRRHSEAALEPGFRVVSTGEHRLGPTAPQAVAGRQSTLAPGPSVVLPRGDWGTPGAQQPLHPTPGAR
jgi:methionine-rich copper-binding protein CopC